MLNIRFNINNPWSKRWGIVKVIHGNLPLPNKFWEFQIDKTNDILGFEFRVTKRTDHAGIWLCLALAGFEMIFNIYDSRHWDEQTNEWKT